MKLTLGLKIPAEGGGSWNGRLRVRGTKPVDQSAGISRASISWVKSRSTTHSAQAADPTDPLLGLIPAIPATIQYAFDKSKRGSRPSAMVEAELLIDPLPTTMPRMCLLGL